MASVLASSTVDCMFEPQSGQTGRQQLQKSQKSKSIDGCSEKTFMSRNNTRIFMFYIWTMNSLRNDVYDLFINTHV